MSDLQKVTGETYNKKFFTIAYTCSSPRCCFLIELPTPMKQSNAISIIYFTGNSKRNPVENFSRTRASWGQHRFKLNFQRTTPLRSSPISCKNGWTRDRMKNRSRHGYRFGGYCTLEESIFFSFHFPKVYILESISTDGYYRFRKK